jgi:DNA-binding CsgD family transcriptional regulator
MPPARDSDTFAHLLRELDGPLLEALNAVPAPIWMADRLGLVRWLNVAASALFGAKPGAHFSRFVAADGVAEARERFARKIHGRLDSTVQRMMLSAAAGVIEGEVTSVPIRVEGKVVGVMTLVRTDGVADDRQQRVRKPRLTPRQHQVLELLAHGRSTAEIAQTLQIAEDTVRNHVRYLLTELGVRTPLEAVVTAFRNGWL